jgi:glutamate dehydrogenase/leucine dehydrogenase
MEVKIVKGLKDMHELAQKHNIDNRRAAMVLAVSRVLEAFNHKGIWP